MFDNAFFSYFHTDRVTISELQNRPVFFCVVTNMRFWRFWVNTIFKYNLIRSNNCKNIQAVSITDAEIFHKNNIFLRSDEYVVYLITVSKQTIFYLNSLS